MAKSSNAQSSDAQSNDNKRSEIQESAPVGKGRPTPSRREAQAAKAQPLVTSARDKSARKAERQKMAEAREKARLGMMQGDERYLTVRDRGPQRRYIRDYVDARISVGEFLIPAMVLVLIGTFLPPAWQAYSLIAIWAYLGLSILDAVILGFTLKRKLAAKFGADKVQPGYRWYAAMRALQFRMLRIPKPQVKRLRFPD